MVVVKKTKEKRGQKMTPLKNFRDANSYADKLQAYYISLSVDKGLGNLVNKDWEKELDKILTLRTPMREQAFVESIVKN